MFRNATMPSAFRRRFRRRPARTGAKPENEGLLIKQKGVIARVHPLPDGERFFLTQYSGKLHLYSLRTGECLRTYTGHTDPTFGIVLLGDDIFASASVDSSILVHRISDGTKLDCFNYNKSFTCASSIGEGRFLVGTSEGEVLEMQWNEAYTLTHNRTVVACSYGINDISVCGNRFAICSIEGSVVAVFGIASFKRVGVVNLLEPRCIHLTDLLLVIGFGGRKIFIYNSITLDFIRKIQNHSAPVSSVHVMPDSRHLLSSAWDGVLCVQDIKTRTPLWQKQFNIDVYSTTPLSDGRLITVFWNEQTIVHNIRQDVAELMTPPPTPLQSAFESCIAGVEIPAEKCKELITYEKCRASFDEWCCAHQLLMMAVEDGGIPCSQEYNGETSWWFKNLYLAVKDIQTASDDDVRTIERFLMQARRIRIVERIERILSPMRLTRDLKAEVRALKHANILTLERVFGIEERLDKLKEGFDRFRRYRRNSSLLIVALQIIPTAGESVVGIVSVGVEVLGVLLVKDFTDYLLGLGSSQVSHEVSSMSQRVFHLAADVLSPETLSRMQVERRWKLEEALRSCDISVSELRMLFLARAKHARELVSQASAMSASAAEPEIVEVTVEEAEDEIQPRVLEMVTGKVSSANAANARAENGDGAGSKTAGDRTAANLLPSSWKEFKLDREDIAELSQEQLASLCAAYIVLNDDTRLEEYIALRDCLVSALREEKLFAEVILDSSAVPSEELVQVVTDRMLENGVRITMGVRGKMRQFLRQIRRECYVVASTEYGDVNVFLLLKP